MEPPEALRPFARVVRAGEVALHCFVAGAEGAPGLLLVHGLGDEGDTWRRMLPALAERYRVVAPDLPGFGRSEGLPGATTVGALARTLVALLGALGVGRATVVGHSGGAMAAQRLALGAPGLVERLVLVAGCLPVARQLPPPGPLWIFLAPGAGELAYGSLRRSQDEAYATLRPYYADLDALPAEEREFLRRRVWARVWSNRQRAAFLSMLRWSAIDGYGRAGQYRAAMARCLVPTALVWGEQDAVMPRSLGEAVVALVPGARMHVIPACGHNVQHERPAELAAIIG
ncbi:MAG: alpha/beta fold hydrolase [Chloroflexales bacterium]|nr:alpha/beta fold hydrolase [Chloroflexales bacterium]